MFSPLCIALAFSVNSHGNDEWITDSLFEAHVQRGIQYTYNLEFEQAKREFTEIVKTHPDHPAGPFFLAMTDWWRILLDLDDDSYDEKFFDELGKVIDLANARLEKNENDITGLFFKGGAIGFRGRLHANRNHWARAANDGRRALGIVKKAYELDPNNSDILFGIGIYNYYAEVAPERYPLLKPLMWFLPKGDKAKGIEQLKLAAQHAKYASTEAAYFLAQLYFYFEKNYTEALQISKTLHEKYPNNSLFQRYVGRCYVALGRLDEAQEIFRDVLKRHEESRPGYNKASAREAYYYLGMFYLNGGKPDEALKYFTPADKLSAEIDKGSSTGFRTMTNLRMGMAYDMLKKRDEAVQSYRRVLAMDDYEGAHKLAKQYIEKPYASN